jgi:hypothetical protein
MFGLSFNLVSFVFLRRVLRMNANSTGILGAAVAHGDLEE